MASLTPDDCTADTCPVPDGFFSSPPSQAGTAFFMAAFGVLATIHFFLGIRYRMLLYSAAMVSGLLLEIMGCVGRILLRGELANRTYFVVFFFGTTAGPTLISAAIYVVLPHYMTIYGSDVCVVSRPIYIGVLFLAFDVFTLAFQAIGCTFATDGITKAEVCPDISRCCEAAC